MTEYALILAAIAIVVFVAYTSTGKNIDTMVSWSRDRPRSAGNLT